MTATAQAAQTSTWNIDGTHSQVGFSVKHLMISNVRGHFDKVSGTVQVNDQDWTKSVADVSIDVSSVTTGVGQRDDHLKSADFFDVAQFPNITFVSRRIQPSGSNFDLIGDLTIHGVTREVTLKTSDEGRGKDPWGGERAAFSATTTIDRRDYGLLYNQALETGGVLVGNDIKVSLEIQLVKSAPQA